MSEVSQLPGAAGFGSDALLAATRKVSMALIPTICSGSNRGFIAVFRISNPGVAGAKEL